MKSWQRSGGRFSLSGLTRRLSLFCLGVALTATAACGQSPPPGVAPPAGSKAAGAGSSDMELVERLLAARRDYQVALEALRTYYQQANDAERSKWAEEELRQYHRILKQAYRLELDLPPPTLQAQYPIPEATELYRRAMTYKNKGWGNDYIDNQRRAEILLQQILTSYPQSDMIDDAAFQLGDLYEGKAYKQYKRAAQYFERCFQWNPQTETDARLRAAHLYDKQIGDRVRAQEIYGEVKDREKDPKRVEEAKKRLAELGGGKK